MTERKLPGPAEPAERGEPARDRIITHIEPDRKLDSVCPDKNQNVAVEAGTIKLEPFQPDDDRKAGFGVVKGEKPLEQKPS